MTRLIIGCGYVGELVARRWIEQGERVFATTRSQSKAEMLKALGVHPILWDWCSDTIPRHMDGTAVDLGNEEVRTVLISVSHAVPNLESAESVPQRNQPEDSPGKQAGLHEPVQSEGLPRADFGPNSHAFGLQNVMRWLNGDLTTSKIASNDKSSKDSKVERRKPRWIYLSTTGVMSTEATACSGQKENEHLPANSAIEMLDETTPKRPLRAGAKNAASGEDWFSSKDAAETDSKIDSVILRPAGIYGPSRVPNLKALRERIPLEVSPESCLNLIHVDDLVQVISYFADNRPKHNLYCVSDNHPVLRQDYYEYIAKLCDLPSPVFSNLAAHRNGLPNASSNARVSAKEQMAELNKKTTDDAGAKATEVNFNHRNAANPPRRGQTSKRISSDRLHQEIPFSLEFPSYQEGLRALLKTEND